MITYEQIKPYIDKKLVGMGFHPENPDVRIFNYTQQCQFDKAWDDITKQCRGLILNVKTGEVLARPFPKFFNYGEHVEKGWPIPTETPEVYEKLDGSLGILYYLNGKPWIATRGSFTSDQAVWATNWWRKNVISIEDHYIVAQRTEWRKDFAIKAQKKANPGVLFALLDQEGKKASLQIWKMLRPHGATVFKTDIDL